MKRSRVLRIGLGLLAAPGAIALSACGAATSGGQSPQMPSSPVELEYWHTNADTTPTEQGRAAALKAAEAANPQLFKTKLAEPAGPSLTKAVASMAAGTPPNPKIDYPLNAAQ